MLAMMVVVGIVVLVVVRIIVLAWMWDGMSTLIPQDGIGLGTHCPRLCRASMDVLLLSSSHRYCYGRLGLVCIYKLQRVMFIA